MVASGDGSANTQGDTALMTHPHGWIRSILIRASMYVIYEYIIYLSCLRCIGSCHLVSLVILSSMINEESTP